MKAQAGHIVSVDQAIPVKSERLLSLDALRGFDMFWIISGEEIFHGIANVVKDKYQLVQDPESWQITLTEQLSITERIAVAISNQLHHAPWNGFTFYDLIFPLFIFIAGISMPYSYSRYLSPTSPKVGRDIYYSLIKRTFLLIIFGMVVNGLLKFAGYENTRFASVLGRIALACFFAAIIYLNTNLKKQLIIFSAILLGYWALMMLVPVPQTGAGILTPGVNLAAYIDQQFLPGKLHRKVYDPEGLLSTIPAIATALLGVFTGRFLRWKNRFSAVRKMQTMFIASLVLLAFGLLWNQVFPINKNIWTSSFVLYAGGWSLLLFSLFYGIIDVAGLKQWCKPFLWIGTNSILIYMAAHGLINFEHTSRFLLGGIGNLLAPSWQHAFIWTGVLLIQLLLLRFLHQRKLFLKI
jgi:predicted acyltransferase